MNSRIWKRLGGSDPRCSMATIRSCLPIPDPAIRRRRSFPARALNGPLAAGFFLWIHVLAPHYPYLPAAHLGSFLPGPAMRTAEQQIAFSRGATYTPDQQETVDKDRLRYDEFVADADSAFGAFISQLEADGKLRDTAVVITADHGESFQGGVFQHETQFQVLPEIHIPLIVRMPGQQRASRVTLAADHTALAPTILEIAGLPRGPWMHGPSLVPWLKPDSQSAPETPGKAWRSRNISKPAASSGRPIPGRRA